MQHNVCSPTPAELQQYSNFRAPRRRALLWFESIADSGMANVELVLNSNSFTDTFHTLQLCSLDTAEWATPFIEAVLTHTEVSVGWSANMGEMGPQWHLVALYCHSVVWIVIILFVLTASIIKDTLPCDEIMFSSEETWVSNRKAFSYVGYILLIMTLQPWMSGSFFSHKWLFPCCCDFPSVSFFPIT